MEVGLVEAVSQNFSTLVNREDSNLVPKDRPAGDRRAAPVGRNLLGRRSHLAGAVDAAVRPGCTRRRRMVRRRTANMSERIRARY